ncbi:SymE family type I addiction module toxin [Brenneria nigrifluens]|uniref:Type I toxin-antitoxin system SymE family toxin n=1 Tax=Brenneria nigrifluens DSM 30175 = ATCC 13028 TaxID=1121120 RepID=A0ABX5V8I2_9GAMM|nr:SymE family type I addiction module toxin [Brenneria nigrifluens]QCR06831.1 type I toxin-antitoxin system SymE family toxin [Brenneria nigrifluens DSM 30175 = ATCC 13028]
MNLKGRWLEECGFMTGMPVTVTVERGRIIIETQINL